LDVARELETLGASKVKFKIGDLVRRKPEHTLYETQRECGVVTGLLLGDLVRISWVQTRTECVCPAHKLEQARKSAERTSG
jgi:hypothetical protein